MQSSKPSATPTRVRWTIVYILLLITTHAFLTRFSMSVAVQKIQQESGLSNIDVGKILSAFILGYALPQFPIGILIDRWGPHRMLFAAILGWSGLTLAIGAVHLLPTSALVAGLITARILAGAAQSGVLSCGVKAVSRWMPLSERASANGIVMMGLGIGGAISPSLMVWLTTGRPWTFAFYIIGISGILIAFVWSRWATNSPQSHPGVSAAELAFITADEQVPSKPLPTPWRGLFSHTSVWALALSYGIAGYTSYVFFTWFFLYLVNVRHMTLTSGGLWAGFPYVCVAFGTLGGGRLSDALVTRFGRRRGRLSVVLMGECLAAILILCGGRVENAYLAVILFSIATGLHLFGQTASWAAAIDIAPSHSASLFGVMNTLAQASGVIAPIATPAIAARFGWTAALDFAALMVIIAALLWLLVNPAKRITLAHEA